MIESKVFEIDNYLTVQEVCTTCQSKQKMMAIIGDPGVGKTVALQSFAKQHKNVFYLRVRKSMGIKDFYIRLLASMGYKNTSKEYPRHFIMNKIAGNLNLADKNLVIIDEAGKFKPGQLEYIHELRDLTEHTTGIVLAGPEYFKDNLDKWKKDNVIGIPELHRRIFSFVELDNPSKREVSYICKHFGINNTKAINRMFKDT
ncbi:MAG: ATP-binding protein, partial [Nonlabens ulvanivorans]